MSTQIIRPDQPLLDELLSSVELSLDCLFTVAYIQNPELAALSRIKQAIERRCVQRRFRLRVLFRSVDVQTHPEAIKWLMGLERETAGRVSVRFGDDKFHAKAFAFKANRNSHPKVYIGSANLTEKALLAPSGEMGVYVDSKRACQEAWETMADMFDAGGNPSRPGWMKRYEERFREKEEIRSEADSIRMPTRLGKTSTSASWGRIDRFFVLQLVDNDPAEAKAIDRAWVVAREEDSALPARPLCWPFETLQAAKDFAEERYPLVLAIHQNPDRQPGDRLRSLAFVVPQKVLRLWDPETRKRYPVVWYTPCRAARATFPRRGRKVAAVRQLLHKHGVTVRFLENQSERLPQPQTCEKLRAVVVDLCNL